MQYKLGLLTLIVLLVVPSVLAIQFPIDSLCENISYIQNIIEILYNFIFYFSR